MVTGQLPSPPVVFWLLAKLAELCPTEARLPARARHGKSSEEISEERAPEKNFRAAGPDEGGARGAGAGTYNPKDSSQKTS